jgi:thiol:disulfide interchange protein
MKKLLLGLFACGLFLQVQAEDAVWLTDMPKALQQAQAEHKIVLADFTGSDWCVWCKKLDKDTFSQPEFADYAKKNLVLLQLDYPDKKPQSDELKAANAALSSKYNIQGYPTLIALKPDATIVWRNDGYLEGGPKAIIGALDAAKQK